MKRIELFCIEEIDGNKISKYHVNGVCGYYKSTRYSFELNIYSNVCTKIKSRSKKIEQFPLQRASIFYDDKKLNLLKKKLSKNNIREIIDAGFSIREAVIITGNCYSTLKRWADALKVKINPPSHPGVRNIRSVKPNLYCKDYEKGFSLCDVAKKYGVCASTVRSTLITRGVKLRSGNGGGRKRISDTIK